MLPTCALETRSRIFWELSKKWCFARQRRAKKFMRTDYPTRIHPERWIHRHAFASPACKSAATAAFVVMVWRKNEHWPIDSRYHNVNPRRLVSRAGAPARPGRLVFGRAARASPRNSRGGENAQWSKSSRPRTVLLPPVTSDNLLRWNRARVKFSSRVEFRACSRGEVTRQVSLAASFVEPGSRRNATLVIAAKKQRKATCTRASFSTV